MIGEIIGINYDVAVNLGDLIFVVLIAVSGYLVFGLRIYDDRLFVKERDAIKTCRKKGLPLIIKAHPGTGEAYAEVVQRKTLMIFFMNHVDLARLLMPPSPAWVNPYVYLKG